MIHNYEGTLTLPEAMKDSCDYCVFDNRTMHIVLYNICDVFRMIYFNSPKSKIHIKLDMKKNRNDDVFSHIDCMGVLYLEKVTGKIYDWCIQAESGDIYKFPLGEYLFGNVGNYINLQIIDVDYDKYKKHMDID